MLANKVQDHMVRFHHLPIFVVPNVSLKLFKSALLGGVAEAFMFCPFTPAPPAAAAADELVVVID